MTGPFLLPSGACLRGQDGEADSHPFWQDRYQQKLSRPPDTLTQGFPFTSTHRLMLLGHPSLFNQVQQQGTGKGGEPLGPESEPRGDTGVQVTSLLHRASPNTCIFFF